LFQPEDSSQSRTNCLSKLGGLLPSLQLSAGQKRLESGVSTSLGAGRLESTGDVIVAAKE